MTSDPAVTPCQNFRYEECDIPEGMTIAQWRRARREELRAQRPEPKPRLRDRILRRAQV